MPRSRSARAQSSLPDPSSRGAVPPLPELSKEDINALPIRAYEGDIRLIRDEEALAGALESLRREDLLGFDTETRPIFTKGKTCPPALLQLAAHDCVYLVQLRHLPFDERLAGLLADPRIIKAGVAVRDDMLALERLRPFVPAGAVDLAVLAKARGMKAQGLRNLAANLLGFRISKSAQCSNWEKDELSPQQIRYAATDAWVGRELYAHLS
ncbi:MAG: 3'-5' exonuclease domain-containing protein 2 [Desulfovibrionaceae bacterium]|nr:3'-5' exonuclease domain-containing protein 2 [Desulfovibrionaceae bacterium]